MLRRLERSALTRNPRMLNRIQNVVLEQGPVWTGIGRVFQKFLDGPFHAIQVSLIIPDPVWSSFAERNVPDIMVFGFPFVNSAFRIQTSGNRGKAALGEKTSVGPDVPFSFMLNPDLFRVQALSAFNQKDAFLAGS